MSKLKGPSSVQVMVYNTSYMSSFISVKSYFLETSLGFKLEVCQKVSDPKGQKIH